MQYLIICKLDSPFLSKWCLFPSWENKGGDVVCIVDLATNKYIMHTHWKDENNKPDWQEIEEDHL